MSDESDAQPKKPLDILHTPGLDRMVGTDDEWEEIVPPEGEEPLE